MGVNLKWTTIVLNTSHAHGPLLGEWLRATLLLKSKSIENGSRAGKKAFPDTEWPDQRCPSHRNLEPKCCRHAQPATVVRHFEWHSKSGAQSLWPPGRTRETQQALNNKEGYAYADAAYKLTHGGYGDTYCQPQPHESAPLDGKRHECMRLRDFNLHACLAVHCSLGGHLILEHKFN